jgi:hypothetical protein
MLATKQNLLSSVRDWLRPHVRPRRFHAFGVGMPKTGTHSLAGVFSRYRAWHEPERQHVMQIIMARANGDLADSAARDQVRRLDRRMWLELNASWHNYLLLDLLVEEFPRAKFVLTIRDCYSWLDSILNEVLGRTHSEYMKEFHRWYAGTFTPGSHDDGDRVLADHGLWPLDMWLQAWNQHNSRVISLVPSDRLLIVRTQDIRSDIPKLAEFLGRRPETLDAGRSHEFKAEAKLGLLSKMDRNYLQSRVEAQCADLMQRFFPEIRSLSDVRGFRPADAAAPIKVS